MKVRFGIKRDPKTGELLVLFGNVLIVMGEHGIKTEPVPDDWDGKR